MINMSGYEGSITTTLNTFLSAMISILLVVLSNLFEGTWR